MHPAVLAVVLVLIAGLYREAVVAADWDGSFGPFVVKGVQLSDARQWDTMAAEFAAGQRLDPGWQLWGARRPFYWIFLGGVYALTGPSVAVARILNVLLGAISAGLIFDLVRRLASVRLALLAALAHATLAVDAAFCLATLTEPLAAFLGVAALAALVLGMTRLPPHVDSTRWPWPFLLSGVLLGLAGLTQPVALLVLAAWPFLVLLLVDRGAARRRALLAVGLLAGACAVTLVPWLLRQYLQYGFWTVDGDSAAIFYAATSPRYGAWNWEIPNLVWTMPLRRQHEFFQAGSWENLREYPTFYPQNVFLATMRHVSQLRPAPWLALAASVLFVVSRWSSAAWGERRLRLLVGAAAVVVASFALPTALWPLTWVAAVVLAAWRREPICLLAAMLVMKVVAMGLVGYKFGERFLVSSEWIAATLMVWLVFGALDIAVGMEHKAEPERPRWPAAPPWGRIAKPLAWVSAAAILVWTAGLARAVTAGLGPHPAPPPVTLSATEAAPWIDAALATAEGGVFRPLRERLHVRRGRIRPDYVMSFWVGEAVDHRTPLYTERRLYSFDVFETSPRLPEYHAVFPGRVEDLIGQDVILVGVTIPRHSEGTSLELIAIARADADPARATLRLPDPLSAALHANYLGTER